MYEKYISKTMRTKKGFRQRFCCLRVRISLSRTRHPSGWRTMYLKSKLKVEPSLKVLCYYRDTDDGEERVSITPRNQNIVQIRTNLFKKISVAKMRMRRWMNGNKIYM